jgi:hypothetical protein
MPYRTYVRDAAWRLAPGLMADRARRYERGFRERRGITAAAERLVTAQGPVVSSGPFAGLRYPADRLGDVDTPVGKLTGVYEAEIRQPFEAAIAAGVQTFIDVGCADGYYAAGMPYASPGLTTYAFDLASSARELCNELARANGVEDRVRIHKRFSAESLDHLDPAGALLLCDIEGAELDLFDHDLVPRLTHTTVVIEVHEDARPGAGGRIQSIFIDSHSLQVIEQRDVNGGVGITEHRPPLLHWLVAEPMAA